jgi:hypothetical protein
VFGPAIKKSSLQVARQCKLEVKLSLCTLWRYTGECRFSSTLLSSAINANEWSVSHLNRFIPFNQLNSRLDRPQNWFSHLEENKFVHQRGVEIWFVCHAAHCHVTAECDVSVYKYGRAACLNIWNLYSYTLYSLNKKNNALLTSDCDLSHYTPVFR